MSFVMGVRDNFHRVHIICIKFCFLFTSATPSSYIELYASSHKKQMKFFAFLTFVSRKVGKKKYHVEFNNQIVTSNLFWRKRSNKNICVWKKVVRYIFSPRRCWSMRANVFQVLNTQTLLAFTKSFTNVQNMYF